MRTSAPETTTHVIITVMIAYVLYSKDAPGERDLKFFVERLSGLGVEAKMVEADSHEGVGITENYDLTNRPAVALVTSDGLLVERWQGELPLAEDVSYLAHA